MVCSERFLDSLMLARHQIDAKLIAKRNQVAPGVTVTFGILGNELLDARRRHGHRPFLFTLLELHRRVERTLERRLEIECNRWRLAFGALRIAALPRLELIFLRRMAGADLVLRRPMQQVLKRGNVLRHSRANFDVMVGSFACEWSRIVGGSADDAVHAAGASGSAAVVFRGLIAFASGAGALRFQLIEGAAALAVHARPSR